MLESERFWSNVFNAGDGKCWPWTGTYFSPPKGYGQFRSDRIAKGIRGKVWIASRMAYLLCKGEIPDGAWVLHACDNPSCCNPEHLYLGGPAENTADCIRRGRACGSRVVTAKLNENDVRTIRMLHAAGANTMTALANHFGVTATMISYIVKRHSWKHVS